MNGTPSHRLSVALIAAIIGALLLAVTCGTASAQSGGAIGRGFTGVAKSIDPVNGLLTVESKGTFFQLNITEDTVINNLPDHDVGLEGLPTDAGFRIAGLVNRAVTDNDGVVTLEILNAEKITVIPGKATRRHHRTIAVDKRGGDLTTLDEDGATTDLPGRASGFEKGDKIILLLQNSGRGGIGDRVRGLFRADIVSDRLARLAQAEAHDLLRAADLADLRDRLRNALEARLQRTADNAGTDYRDFVLDTVRTFRDSAVVTRGSTATGQTVSECARSIVGLRVASINDLSADQRQRVTAQCLKTADTVVDESSVIHITSPASGTVVSANEVVTVTAETRTDVRLVSVTFNIAGRDLAPLTEGPYVVEFTVPTGVSSVEIKVTAVDTQSNELSDSIVLRVARAVDVGVKITSPVAGAITTSAAITSARLSTLSGTNEAIAEGDTIFISAEATGMGAITVVFTVNGVDQTPIAAPPYSMRYFVPLTPASEDPPPLKITATATDGTGNTATDSVNITVVRKTNEINVTITSPPADAKLNAGDTIVIRAETDNDREIAFVTFSVDGVETVTTVAPFTHTYVLPPKASTTAAASSLPPHVFVGNVTLDGARAPDGTVVIAWINGSDVSTLTIKVTATANSGNTGSASLTLKVSGSINAGEATVTKGEYILTAAQPSGQNFTGKTVTFTVGGKDARQTAIWKKGGATVLDLTAN